MISAGPVQIIRSALEGIIPADHIFGTEFEFNSKGEIERILQVTAGYGKVAAIDHLLETKQLGPDRVVYVGDGSSDIHVMLHVNRRDGYTIAVSENKYLAPIAKRSILSDNALATLIPILEDVVGWDAASIRSVFEAKGLVIQQWDKVQTDMLTIVPDKSPALESRMPVGKVKSRIRRRNPARSSKEGAGWVTPYNPHIPARPGPRVESQFHGVIPSEFQARPVDFSAAWPARTSAVAPAQRVFRDPAADGVGDAGAGDRLPARDVRGVGVWRGAEDRRLRRGVHHSRFSLLPAGWRDRLDHLHLHLCAAYFARAMTTQHRRRSTPPSR